MEKIFNPNIKTQQDIKLNFDIVKQKIKFPDLMEGKPINSLGLKYEPEIEKYSDKITNAFDTLTGATVTHIYNNKPVRLKLTDLSLVAPLCKFFINETGGELSEVTVTRNCVTDVPSPVYRSDFIESEHWYSELWHVDGFKNGNFKIGIYLTDVVDEGCAPFEYLPNPEENFYVNAKIFGVESRFFNLNPKETIKVLAPKNTTLIFTPDFIHKGNYARTHHRDFIMIGFNQGRVDETAKEVLKLI